jgi:hypothetical protein
MFDGLSLDPFALLEDGSCPAEVGVAGRQVAQALVITLVVVALDERLDLGLKVAGQEVVFLANAVFKSGASARSYPGFGDALGRRTRGSFLLASIYSAMSPAM